MQTGLAGESESACSKPTRPRYQVRPSGGAGMTSRLGRQAFRRESVHLPAASLSTLLHAPSPPACSINSGSSRSLARPEYGATEMHRHPASARETFLSRYSDDTDFTRIACDVIGCLSIE